MRTFLFTLCTITFLSCSSSRPTTELSQSDQADSLISFSPDLTLMLMMNLTADHASVHRAKLVEGRYKPFGEKVRQKEMLQIRYLDGLGNMLLTKHMNNPLIQYREYADDEGVLRYVRTEEPEASVLVRSPYSTQMRKIVVRYAVGDDFRNIAVLPIPELK